MKLWGALLLSWSCFAAALPLWAELPAKPEFAREDSIVEQEVRKVHLEDDGTGQLQTTLRVRLLTEAGVRSWGLVRAAYDAGSQSLELRDVRVRKPTGALVAPSLDQVQEVTAPVAANAPMYSEYREKHFAVPDLHPGDSLEYTTVVTVRKPRAPGQFWFSASFYRDAIALDEQIEVDVPSGRALRIRTAAGLTPVISETSDRRTYRFTHSTTDVDAVAKARKAERRGQSLPADVALSTFRRWEDVGAWYGALERDRIIPTAEVRAKAGELTSGLATDAEKIKALYEYVSGSVRYVSLSLGMASVQPHPAAETLANAYGDCKDKHTLLAALLASVGIPAHAALIRSVGAVDEDVPFPQFDHVITAVPQGDDYLWLDTTTEIGPLGWLAPQIRGQRALVVSSDPPAHLALTPAEPLFRNEQRIEVEAQLEAAGRLVAHQQNRMHGDAAVILRAALRLAPADVKTQVMEKAVKAMAEAMNLEATVEKVSFGSESKAEAFDWSADYSIDHLVDTTSTASESSALLRIPEWLGRFPAADELPFTPDGQLRLLGPGTFQVHAKIGLPPDWTLVPPAPSASSVDFADYRASYLLEGHALILERTLSFRALALPEARGADYEALRSQLSREPRVLSVERHRSDTKPAPAAASEAQALVKAAVAECHDHDYESCAAKLRRAVELVPDHKSAWNELGRAYLAKRETDRALAALQKQIEIVPAHLYAYNNLGLALRQAHRDVEAEAAFRKQLEINPEDRFAHRNLAYLLSATKRYRDAVPEFEMAAAIEPKSATLEVGLGTAYLGEGEDDKALAAFEKALELAPGAFVWNSAAYALAEASKHLDRAEKWARSAIAAVAAELSSVPAERLAPADENASYRLAEDWDTLGWVYFRRGLDGDALRYLAAAFGLRPTSIGADHLGQVYEHAGDKSKALHAYALAVSISSDFAEARQRLDTLAGGESEAVSILTEARADLPQLSSLRIGRPSGLKGELSQDLLVALGSNLRILAAETTTPLPRNEALARALVGVEHGLQFPDPAPPRVVRRARLVCPREGDCRLSYPQESQGPPVISGVGANTQAGAPPAAGVGGKVEPPRKIKNVNPVYPETAKQAGIEGKVVLQCTVRTDGTVAEVKVVNSIPELDDAAVAAVRGWVYEPARLKGVAMPVVMTVTVNFQLNSP